MPHSIFCEQLKISDGEPLAHEHYEDGVIIRLKEEISDKEIDKLWKIIPKENKIEGGKLIIFTPTTYIEKKLTSAFC